MQSPSFVRLSQIDLSNCIEFDLGKANPKSGYEHRLVAKLNEQHEKLFQNLATLPGWRLVVMSRQAGSANFDEVDIMFAYHHAFFDGLSGVVFHKALSRALGATFATKSEHNSSVFQVPSSMTLTPPLEDLMELPVSWLFLMRYRWRQFVPSWLNLSFMHVQVSTAKHKKHSNRGILLMLYDTPVPDLGRKRYYPAKQGGLCYEGKACLL